MRLITADVEKPKQREYIPRDAGSTGRRVREAPQPDIRALAAAAELTSLHATVYKLGRQLLDLRSWTTFSNLFSLFSIHSITSAHIPLLEQVRSSNAYYEYLASGMSQEEILRDFPDLEAEDIKACLTFAADRERKLFTAPA
jgi:hypothetical protein